jgi:hypothetical protein
VALCLGNSIKELRINLEGGNGYEWMFTLISSRKFGIPREVGSKRLGKSWKSCRG